MCFVCETSPLSLSGYADVRLNGDEGCKCQTNCFVELKKRCRTVFDWFLSQQTNIRDAFLNDIRYSNDISILTINAIRTYIADVVIVHTVPWSVSLMLS